MDTINELISRGTSKDCIIVYGTEEEACTSYAKVWFLDNEPIVAEPYATYGSDVWYYNRETDFRVTYIEEPLIEHEGRTDVTLTEEIIHELENIELIME